MELIKLFCFLIRLVLGGRLNLGYWKVIEYLGDRRCEIVLNFFFLCD